MLEKPRQGLWNGSQPPFGYRTVEAERHGHKIKKRLEAELAEAETVVYAFKGGTDGHYPYGGLTAVKGTLYGTTEEGGSFGHGTLFAIKGF